MPHSEDAPSSILRRLKVKQHRHAARLKCGLNVRLAQKPLCLHMSGLSSCDRIVAVDFQPSRMRAVWRHD